MMASTYAANEEKTSLVDDSVQFDLVIEWRGVERIREAYSSESSDSDSDSDSEESEIAYYRREMAYYRREIRPIPLWLESGHLDQDGVLNDEALRRLQREIRYNLDGKYCMNGYYSCGISAAIDTAQIVIRQVFEIHRNDFEAFQQRALAKHKEATCEPEKIKAIQQVRAGMQRKQFNNIREEIIKYCKSEQKCDHCYAMFRESDKIARICHECRIRTDLPKGYKIKANGNRSYVIQHCETETCLNRFKADHLYATCKKCWLNEVVPTAVQYGFKGRKVIM